MQFKTAVIAFFASLAAAQDLSLLPACATACFIDNFPVSGCADTTDFACICASAPYNTAVTSCVVGACEFLDVLAALEWSNETCDSAGVVIKFM